MYTVVVADDEKELRQALIRKVDWGSAGFTVIGEAENGAEALELVEQLEPDLLLTDIRMPFLSGIELARQVREVRPATQIAFLSGYDDFSYAQQAIQYNIISYMLKPISSAEMLEELKNIKNRIDEKFRKFVSAGQGRVELSEFLMPLVLDGFQREADEEQNQRLMDEAVRCGLMKDSHSEFCYTVMVVSILDEQGRNMTSQDTINAIDMILRKYIRHTSFYTEGRVVSLLLASQAGFDKYLHILVEDIAQSVKRIMGMTCTVGVSRPVARISSVHEAYVEAMNAIGYSRSSETEVYFISDVERTEVFDLEMIQSAVSDIEDLIRGGSRQELEESLTKAFERVGGERPASMASSFLIVQLVSSVFRIAYALGDQEAIRSLQKCAPLQGNGSDDTSEMRGQCIHFCLTAHELISEQRKKSSTVLCDRALELIETQYMDPELSLMSISTEISVSPNYLSALIKKKTGSTFVDILTRKRIETAKELLLCSSMKIKEISERCGYNDQHYFSYCFKKYTGMSPIMCRRNHEQTGQ